MLLALYLMLPVVFLVFYVLIISETQVASEDGVLCRGEWRGLCEGSGKREAVEKR